MANVFVPQKGFSGKDRETRMFALVTGLTGHALDFEDVAEMIRHHFRKGHTGIKRIYYGSSQPPMYYIDELREYLTDMFGEAVESVAIDADDCTQLCVTFRYL